jgi:hypothetical protein
MVVLATAAPRYQVTEAIDLAVFGRHVELGVMCADRHANGRSERGDLLFLKWITDRTAFVEFWQTRAGICYKSANSRRARHERDPEDCGDSGRGYRRL